MNKRTFSIFILLLTILISCTEKTDNIESTILTSDLSEIEEHERNPPFSFVGYSKCSHYENHELNMEAMDTYGRMKPYDIEFIDTAGYTWVKFDAIFECCHIANGSFDIVSDSIILNWGVDLEGGCPCYCDYEFNFYLRKDKFTPELIKIKTRANKA